MFKIQVYVQIYVKMFFFFFLISLVDKAFFLLYVWVSLQFYTLSLKPTNFSLYASKISKYSHSNTPFV